MGVRSLKSAFWVIFSAFAGLVILTSGATFFSLHTQKQDALVINLAGRQRMLLQQAGKQVLRLAALPGEVAGVQSRQVSAEVDQVQRVQRLAELQETVKIFDQTLAALTDGGDAVYLDGDPVWLPQTRDTQAQQLLIAIQQEWRNTKAQVDLLMRFQPGDPGFMAAVDQVQQALPGLTDLSDRLTLRYERMAETKLNQLRLIQSIYLVLAALTITWGVWLMRRKVLAPLGEIDQQAQAIAGGRLEQPIRASGLMEIEQIGVSMEAMRREIIHWQATLESKVAQRTQELEAFAAVSQEISSNLNLELVLQSITDKTRQLLGCEAVFLCLHDEAEDSLHLNSASCGAAVRWQGGEAEPAAMNQPGAAQAAYPLRSNAISLPVLTRCQVTACTSASSTMTPAGTYPASRVLQGELVDTGQSQNGHAPHCQVLDERYQASHLAAPLASDGRVFGALCAGSLQDDFFDEEDRHLLARLAGVASLALQNARLFRQAERLAVLEERQHVAAEIHDGFIQTVNTLRLLQEQLEQNLSEAVADQPARADILRRMRQAAQQAEREARRALTSLYEQTPPAVTLQEQLKQLAEDTSLPAHPVDFHSRVHLPVLLDRQATEQVLRIVREAVANAHKHAQAKHIQVSLLAFDETLAVRIQDDGVGFRKDGSQEVVGRAHYGLQVMEARAQRIGAQLIIETQPGAGTQVNLHLPEAVFNQRGETYEETYLAGGRS